MKVNMKLLNYFTPVGFPQMLRCVRGFLISQTVAVCGNVGIVGAKIIESIGDIDRIGV